MAGGERCLALSGYHNLGGGVTGCREEVPHLGHPHCHLGLGLGFSPPQPSLGLF